MFLKRKMFVASSLILSSALILPHATAATTASPSPFKTVPKVVGLDIAKQGCTSVGASLQINNDFLKLPAAQQTAKLKAKAISAETMAMATAMKQFQSAAKVNKKWKTLADNIKTFLNTSDADTFTKAFGALLTTCTAINPAK